MAPAALRRPCRSDPKAKSTESGLRARPMGTLGIHGNLGGIPFGYSTVRHGIDGPIEIDGLHIKHGDFQWLR